MLGGPILLDLGVPFPESLYGSTEELGKRIRAVLLTPSGEVKPPIAKLVPVLEEAIPVSKDLEAMLTILCRVATVMTFLE